MNQGARNFILGGQMIEIQTVEEGQYYPIIREITWEYLQWVNGKILQEYGVSFDIAEILERNMQELSMFMPPSGRLLLGTLDGKPAGIVFLKPVGEGCAEIKRMYVRPFARKEGLGRALLTRLLDEAACLGYHCIRLDSARFMVEAHRLYRALGFHEISPYAGSEIPPEYQSNWVFMEKELDPAG